MKAAIHKKYGPPEVVSIQEVPQPTPLANEVLIQVKATTVNRTDCGFRSAEYVISRLFSGIFAPKQNTLGCEFAGIVVGIGKSVSNFKDGDWVFGFNDQQFGAHAEYMVMPANGAMALMPPNFSFHEAAALTEGSHYAWCDICAAKVKAGDKVLVNGATGAIGSAAVQILRMIGADVTAVCAGTHIKLVESLGANQVINYQQEDFTRVAHRFDFVFDAVGKSSFTRCKPLLKDHGIYISTELGKNGDNVWRAIFSKYKKGKRVLFPLPTIDAQDVELIRKWAIEGSFKPLIDRSYPLSKIVEAYRYVETGQKIGNVIIHTEE